MVRVMNTFLNYNNYVGSLDRLYYMTYTKQLNDRMKNEHDSEIVQEG